jgi:hypothetical protein
MAPTCGFGFGSTDPLGDLLADPIKGHLSGILVVTYFLFVVSH